MTMMDWQTDLRRAQSELSRQSPVSVLSTLGAYSPFLEALARTNGCSVSSVLNQCLHNFLKDNMPLPPTVSSGKPRQVQGGGCIETAKRKCKRVQSKSKKTRRGKKKPKIYAEERHSTRVTVKQLIVKRNNGKIILGSFGSLGANDQRRESDSAVIGQLIRSMSQMLLRQTSATQPLAPPPSVESRHASKQTALALFDSDFPHASADLRCRVGDALTKALKNGIPVESDVPSTSLLDGFFKLHRYYIQVEWSSILKFELLFYLMARNHIRCYDDLHTALHRSPTVPELGPIVGFAQTLERMTREK